MAPRPHLRFNQKNPKHVFLLFSSFFSLFINLTQFKWEMRMNKFSRFLNFRSHQQRHRLCYIFSCVLHKILKVIFFHMCSTQNSLQFLITNIASDTRVSASKRSLGDNLIKCDVLGGELRSGHILFSTRLHHVNLLWGNRNEILPGS
jgi:hypothetical protein